MRLAKPHGIKRFSSLSLPSLGKELPPGDSSFFWRLQEKPEPAVFRIGGLFAYGLYRIKQGSFMSLMVLCLSLRAKHYGHPYKNLLSQGREAI